MLNKLHIQHDWAAVLAIAFGAAVVIPSLVAVLIAIIAVARTAI